MQPACELLGALCRAMSDAGLAANLSTIIVSILPLCAVGLGSHRIRALSLSDAHVASANESDDSAVNEVAISVLKYVLLTRVDATREASKSLPFLGPILITLDFPVVEVRAFRSRELSFGRHTSRMCL